ncbi:MAG: YggS family pyridoxal phosphate-dependent enzyme [Candidatus Limnocylindrales bacterium]
MTDPGITPPGPPDPDLVAGFRERAAAVRRTIADACARVGRDPIGVRLVAVSKTVPPATLRSAVAAGITTLGENRVQEAAAKAPLLPGASWHLVGHLQSNKARMALGLFDVIESVDSLELAQRLDRLLGEDADLAGDRLLRPVLLQVNVDDDPAKGGFAPAELEATLPELGTLPRLRLSGLMTVGRLGVSPESARPTFVALRRLSERLRATEPCLGPELSMGMSDDYPVAVEEGATIVRVGRAIFGQRPPA